jgi:hypothetical protein
MNVRRRRPGGWVYVGAAALLTGSCVVLARWWLPGAVASGAGAAATVIAGVWAALGTAVSQERDGGRRAVAWQVRLDGKGKLPLVRDVGDPVSIGVHPSAPAGPGDRSPVFVVRDAMADVRESLLRDRFVLVAGESAAGKSRAAYEVLRELFPSRRLVVPAGRDGLRAALDLAMETPGCVLWLDDLERFLGESGLSGAGIRSLLSGHGRERYVIATMRAEEHARFIGGTGDGMRHSREVLYLAVTVWLPRMWSPAELARAAGHRDDPRIADALQNAGPFGVAEYLAAGPQLLASWRDGWSPGAHPRGAALVLAAVDARRAGIRRPLPSPVLAELHEPYLAARGGILLRPESLQLALEWATTPLHATSSLLIPSGAGMLLAFDYLIDAVPREPPPGAAFDILTGQASPEEAIDIGLDAWYWGQHDQGETAFASGEAADSGPFEATSLRLHLISERDGTPPALAFAHEALTARIRALGPDHPDTFRARHQLLDQEGQALRDADGRVPGDARIADRLAALRDDAARLLGVRSRVTLNIRLAVALWTGVADNPAEAASLASAVTADCEQILGEDDDLAFESRMLLAECTIDAGQHEEGMRLLDEVIADAERRDGKNGQFGIDARRARARWLTRTGHASEAIREWQLLITELAACRGSLHANTLNSRAALAAAVGTRGDPYTAVTMLRQLITDVARVSPEDAIPMLLYRRALADWTGKAGDPAGAAEQLSELAGRSTRKRGRDDQCTRTLLQLLGHWQTAAGTTGNPLSPP